MSVERVKLMMMRFSLAHPVDLVFLVDWWFKHGSVSSRCATTFSKLGVQFFGLGYYYPSTEKLDRSTQFGAVSNI